MEEQIKIVLDFFKERGMELDAKSDGWSFSNDSISIKLGKNDFSGLRLLEINYEITLINSYDIYDLPQDPEKLRTLLEILNPEN